MTKGLALAVCLTVCVLIAAEPANMSGTWTLNATKSKWGKKSPIPHESKITIEHHEPNLKYSGFVQSHDGPRNAFEHEGPIDGKDHPVANGTIRFRRLSDNSVQSVLKSQDGTYEETAVTTISSDGKEMTRRIQGKGPQETITWTEVYDKVQ